MAFKMKGPSLLKMVKQMREGSPMKENKVAMQKVEQKKRSSDMPGNKLQDSMTFDEVFANARKQNKTTFTWRGKSYNTKVKKEEPKKDTVKKVPTIGVQKLKVKKSAEKKGKKDLPDPDFYDVNYEDASDPDRG